MFRSACALAGLFTFPVIVSRRTVSGKCSASLAAFVVINEEGWALTADHVISQIERLNVEAENTREYGNRKKAIESDAALKPKERYDKLKALKKPGPDSTSNFSVWWGGLAVEVETMVGIESVDIAVVKLKDFDPGRVKQYPLIKDPTKGFDVGTSLCKLGFPFHGFTPIWDDGRGSFRLPPGALPVPFFPLDGIFVRTREHVYPQPPSFPHRMIETSTPGLRGQSGGPTFDVQGTIWAIQSQTTHYPLGFSPTVPGTNQIEHQFLNIGVGTHAATIINFLNEVGVKFHLSPY